MCKFNTAWSDRYCFNGLKNNWKKGVNWVNPSFSKGHEWIIQAAIQFYGGLDIVMLLEYDTL